VWRAVHEVTARPGNPLRAGSAGVARPAPAPVSSRPHAHLTDAQAGQGDQGPGGRARDPLGGALLPALLPNGFHDALLRELHVDFARAEARLAFDFLTGIPDAETEEGRESMRPGFLHFTGLAAMSIEPVDARYGFTCGQGVSVNGGFGPHPGDTPPPPDRLVRLWLYASTWNSGMRFVAEACDFGWTKVL
jgi:hypothetical protein